MPKPKYEKWLEADNLIRLEGWARDGLTDEQIAHNMGIATKTLYDYKNRYSNISESLKKGKEVVDLEVENALFKRAMGYKYTETTKENGIVTKEVIKDMAPDTTAQIFWLKNRKPAQWREKQEIEVSEKPTVLRDDIK